VLCVDLVASRRICPAQVGCLVDPDGSRWVPSDRLDDQRDDQGLRTTSALLGIERPSEQVGHKIFDLMLHAQGTTGAGLRPERPSADYNAGCPAALSDHGGSPGYGIASLPSVPPWSTTVSPPMVRVNSSWMAYTYSPDSQAQAGLLMNGTRRMA
jgi:hypothetical protein